MARSRSKPRSTKDAKSTDPTPRPAEAGRSTCRAYLILTAFSAGAAVMIIELAGNRILAPWFGNSLYTWTGLIGVILVSISVGYYLGGYLADRWPRYAVLAHLLTASAVLTILIPSLEASLVGSVAGLVSTLPRASAKWNVMNTTPSRQRPSTWARTLTSPRRDRTHTQSPSLIPSRSASIVLISTRSSGASSFRPSTRRVMLPPWKCSRRRPVVRTSGNSTSGISAGC